MCCRLGTMHVVNHAYGVQSAWLCQQLGTAARRGTVTAGVQSTDKNFMVPVGGALVCDFEGQEGEGWWGGMGWGRLGCESIVRVISGDVGRREGSGVLRVECFARVLCVGRSDE